MVVLHIFILLIHAIYGEIIYLPKQSLIDTLFWAIQYMVEKLSNI